MIIKNCLLNYLILNVHKQTDGQTFYLSFTPFCLGAREEGVKYRGEKVKGKRK